MVGSGLRAGGTTAVASLLEELKRAVSHLKELATADWSSLPASEAKTAVGVLEGAARHTSAIQSSVIARVSSSGAWEGDGERTMSGWVASRTGSTRKSAFKAVELAKTLEEQLPATKEALAAGLISEEHAQVISRECTKSETLRNRLADPLRGEEYLLEKAKGTDATSFTKFAKGWATTGDPKGADRAWRKEAAKDSFTLTPTSEGYRASGHVNPVSGALIQEALNSFMGRKAADDERSFPERQADALASLARQSLDAGIKMPHARIRPHLTVTVEYTTLQRLVEATGSDEPNPTGATTISTLLDYDRLEGLTPATLADGTPVPPGMLARLACESMLTRVVFGPDSTILDAGREERIFPANQVRAIIARDRHCQYPGCDEGPSRSEIHHSLEWFKHRGTTHVDLGVLLCYFHHDLVHQRSIAIARRAGTWVFTHPSGKEIRPPGHSSGGEPPPEGAPPGSRGRWGPDRPGSRGRPSHPRSGSRRANSEPEPAFDTLFDTGPRAGQASWGRSGTSS